MNVQQHHVLINANGQATTNPTLQHYLSNNHISSGSDSTKNVHVQLVKQEQPAQRFIINRQYIQQPPPQQQQPQHIQIQQILPEPYWLIVEIESNNEINSYAFVESKDVVGNPTLDSLTTGKLVIVNIGGKQRRATVVMASCKDN